MNLFVHHDATALARLVGASHPGCTGVILAHPPVGDALASFVDGNPLASDFLLDVELPGRTIVLWSGTLAETLFGDEPRTWMRPGHDALRRFCDAAAPTLLLRGRTLCFRPHVRHVLSDVQGCLNFLRDRAGQPFTIALAPADLLTPDMLANAEEHLTRAFEALGPRAAMVLLHDGQVAGATTGGSDSDVLLPAPFGSGRLPREIVARLLREHVPAATPVVLLPTGVEAQRTLLGIG